MAAGTGSLGLVAVALIVAAKFALPLLIVRFPFVAGWLNFILDGVDGDLLIPLGLPDAIYQPVDKVSDWVTYVAIVIVAYREAWPTKGLMLGLFGFRSLGQVSFLVSGNELFLAAFPNFLEPLFLLTASILAFQRTVRHRSDWRERTFAILARHKLAIGVVIVLYKLQDEYFTHVANLDRSEFVQNLIRQLGGG